MSTTPAGVIGFWMEAGPSRWFEKDPTFDQAIAARFGPSVEEALGGELEDWAETPSGALALTLLLDQFPRNIWREDSRAFSGDEMALKIARLAIERGQDLLLSRPERQWIYMPFMHSERLEVQVDGLALFKDRLDDPKTYGFAVLHHDIIERFGRFPHRNAVLGRDTTPAEQAFLDEGGFSG